MPDGITLDVHGAASAEKALRDLEHAARRRVVTAATRAGLGEFRKAARSRAPSRTGQLRKQLVTRSVKLDKTTGTVTGKVGAKRSKAQARKGASSAGRYLHLVVGSTRPHTIRAARGSALGLPGGPRASVEHPGTVGRPSIDQASQAAFAAAMAAFSKKLRERLAVEVAKVRAAQQITRG